MSDFQQNIGLNNASAMNSRNVRRQANCGGHASLNGSGRGRPNRRMRGGTARIWSSGERETIQKVMINWKILPLLYYILCIYDVYSVWT